MLTTPLACTDDDDTAPTSVAPSSTTTTTTEPVRTNDGVLTIGLLLPLSGEGATIGQGMAEAAERAVGEINAAGGVLGQQVVVVPADEGADASSAADGIETLVAAGVDAVRRPGVVDGRPRDPRRPSQCGGAHLLTNGHVARPRRVPVVAALLPHRPE